MKLGEAIVALSTHTTTLVQGTPDANKQSLIMSKYGEQVTKLFDGAVDGQVNDDDLWRMFNVIGEKNSDYMSGVAQYMKR